jgi:Na+/melibiose symporter-like transporter
VAEAARAPAAWPTGAAADAAWRGGWVQGLAYGALGLPLAFVALPLYLVLPSHYASEFGMPLATIGGLLLAARAFDAFVDPWIGRRIDACLARSPGHVLLWAGAAAAGLALGFRGLFFPPLRAEPALLIWCAALLALSHFSHSVLSVLHQAWGARLGGGPGQQARIVAWREGMALAGVLLASLLPAVAGLSTATGVLAVLLVPALAGLWHTPHPQPLARQSVAAGPQRSRPLANPHFRRLLAVYLVNGIASAVPATLVLFFIRDRLQLQAQEPWFLGSYFIAGALSMPLWTRAVSRYGLPRCWLAGMLLAIASFAGAATLAAGEQAAYIAVCLASGFAMGADLSLPGAMLAGVIQGAGHGQQHEGAYFGWWSFASKLNLALAAGVALPLLSALGYAPGSRSGPALQALTLAYCLLPCLLKLIAAALLWAFCIRHPEHP